MAIEVSYLGMTLEVSDLDPDNLSYFQFCARGAFHLQRCAACSLLRYPPGPSCYWCGHESSRWDPVATAGTVHSFTEVHHAIQPGFRNAAPYAVLIVDLDEQRGRPTQDEALRVVGNLVETDGRLAPAELVGRIGIGSRVKMTFTPVGPDIAIPNWTPADEPGARPWRPDT
jgi:uncharacterized OB-fold protein